MTKDGGNGFDNVDYNSEHENLREQLLLLAGNPVQSARLIKYRTKIASKYQNDWNFPFITGQYWCDGQQPSSRKNPQLAHRLQRPASHRWLATGPFWSMCDAETPRNRIMY